MRKTAAVIVFGSFVLTGCATKGDIEDAMQQRQAALEEAIEQERSERMEADEQLANEIDQLRSDLEAMRTDFNARIEAVAEGLQFVLPVHFAFDEAQVRETDHAVLERFASVVNEHYAGALVTVEGFTDPAGSEAYNRNLAQRRAEAVRDQLMDIGVEAQLRTVGYGEDRLVVEGAAHDDQGAELNRRVVFVIETPSAAVEMGGGSSD
ncbi:MAG: OmpA family protein [Candidatus Longimicrobiales bacterium M2_2A_002]